MTMIATPDPNELRILMEILSDLIDASGLDHRL
jgi:hypothetical protein